MGENMVQMAWWNPPLAVIAVLTSVAFHLTMQFVPPSDLVCVMQSTSYSPLWTSIEYRLTNFGEHYHHSPFRGKSTPLLEHMWNELLQAHLVPVNNDQLAHIQLAKGRQWMHRGTDAVAAVPAVTQQLHCLNLLRLYVHEDASSPNDIERPADIDQCLDLIRAVLVCNGDATPFLVWKDPNRPTDGADMDTMHNCRNLDALQNGMKTHGLGPYSHYVKMAHVG